jgi:hypothetical protein
MLSNFMLPNWALGSVNFFFLIARGDINIFLIVYKFNLCHKLHNECSLIEDTK